MATNTARAYARRHYKSHDEMYIDECVAEAWYIVTRLIIEYYDKVVLEKPTEEERFRFYRTSITFGLQHYWRKFKLPPQLSEWLESSPKNFIADNDDRIAYFIEEEGIIRTGLERKFIDFHLMGNDINLIASKLSLNHHHVRKIKRTIERRLNNQFNLSLEK